MQAMRGNAQVVLRRFTVRDLLQQRMMEEAERIPGVMAVRQVLHAAMPRTALLLATGSVAGLVLGVLGRHILASVVYEATVYDPVVPAGAGDDCDWRTCGAGSHAASGAGGSGCVVERRVSR